MFKISTEAPRKEVPGHFHSLPSKASISLQTWCHPNPGALLQSPPDSKTCPQKLLMAPFELRESISSTYKGSDWGSGCIFQENMLLFQKPRWWHLRQVGPDRTIPSSVSYRPSLLAFFAFPGVNNVVVNLGIQRVLLHCVLGILVYILVYIPWRGIAGSYGRLISRFLKNVHSVF